jgi:hypothetical protein
MYAPEHDHSTAVVVIEINPLGDLSTCHGEKNSTTPIVTGLRGHQEECSKLNNMIQLTLR